MTALGKKGQITGILIFLALLVGGLFYVKWNPYYHKAILAATQHFIGNSFISGQEAAPPKPSWDAALDYTLRYFKSVWQAVVLGLLLGSLVQVLIPRDWIMKLFSRSSAKSTMLAGLMAVPSMMCSCCAAPVVAGLRKQKASLGAALAFWLGNPVLNPAVIVFTGFVLSWKFSLLRIIMGLILVCGVSYLVSKVYRDEGDYEALFEIELDITEDTSLLIRWLKALWKLTLESIPPYLIFVFVLGGVRAWLFPTINPDWAESFLALVALAVTGTLFMIPTAAEIPIVQSLMNFGLGIGPAAALYMTLPAVNVPSILMLKRYIPQKVLVMVFIAVVTTGIISGLLAKLFF